MKKETTDREDFIEALRLAAQALLDARGPVDHLNGRLDELTHYGDETGGLSDEHKGFVQEAIDLYHDLPVWDWMDDLRYNLLQIADELENKNGGTENEDETN